MKCVNCLNISNKFINLTKSYKINDENYMKQNFKSNIIWFIIILFVIFLSVKINSYPVYIDEATTFLEYTSLGFWDTLSNYNEPNNHVFFSILLVIFQKLPIDSLIAMRIPNLLIGIFTIWTLHKYLKTKFSDTASLIGTTIFTFSYAILFYSIFARGYLLIIFCCLFTFKSLDEIEKSYSIKKLIHLGLITVIGFFTIPIYLYVALSFTIVVLIRFWKRRDLVLKLLLMACLSILATIILYSPIIYKNGINAIIKNEYNLPKSTNEIYQFLKNSWIGFYDKIWGVQSGIIVACLLLYAFYLLFILKKERRIGCDFLVFVSLPFIFVLVQKVIPGFRTWTYILVPMILIITSLIEKMYAIFNQKIKILMTISAISSCLIIQIYIFNKSTPLAGHQNDVEANKIATYLIKNHIATSVNFMDGRKDYDAVIYLFEKQRAEAKNNVTFLNKPQNNALNIIKSKNYNQNATDKIIKKFNAKLIYSSN